MQKKLCQVTIIYVIFVLLIAGCVDSERDKVLQTTYEITKQTETQETIQQTRVQEIETTLQVQTEVQETTQQIQTEVSKIVEQTKETDTIDKWINDSFKLSNGYKMTQKELDYINQMYPLINKLFSELSNLPTIIQTETNEKIEKAAEDIILLCNEILMIDAPAYFIISRLKIVEGQYATYDAANDLIYAISQRGINNEECIKFIQVAAEGFDRGINLINEALRIDREKMGIE